MVTRTFGTFLRGTSVLPWLLAYTPKLLTKKTKWHPQARHGQIALKQWPLISQGPGSIATIMHAYYNIVGIWKQWGSYSLTAAQNITAVTPSNRWIHFLLSFLWPPTSKSLYTSPLFLFSPTGLPIIIITELFVCNFNHSINELHYQKFL